MSTPRPTPPDRAPARPAPPADPAPPVPPGGPPPAVSAPDPNPPSAWQRWKDFWFRPADPTTLGFIRITTGLLVLYTYLAYSLDLQAFFGKHGWYAAAYIDRERHETPYYVESFSGDWNEPKPVYPRLSDYPHRRQPLMQYLRSLPADDGGRASAVAYLQRVNTLNSYDATAALAYVQRMGTRRELENSLTVLAGGKVEADTPAPDGGTRKVDLTPTYSAAIPAAFAGLPQEEKARLAAEVRAFWSSLDAVQWAHPDRDRNYVFNHFTEAGPEARKALLDYIISLPADGAEREKLLGYLERWNNDPRKAYRVGSSIFSVWFHVTDPTQMALVHTGVLLVIVLFTLGLFTRVTSVLVWIATVSYIHRTQQVLFGMDTMMNILLFYLMIGNSGAALSLDRVIARYRAARASLRRSGTIDANTRAFLACPPPSVSAGFALRLIQVHFCFIYAAAGLAKLKGHMWWSGQAFWEVIGNPEFTLMQYPWYEKTLRFLASAKPVYYFITISAVWFTLFIEIATPFLVWTRLRWLVVFLATAMHAMIGVLMGLNLFELLMIVMLLAFLPDRVIRDRFRGGPDLPRLGYVFNPQTATHQRAAALALALDTDNQIALEPDPKAPATAVTAPDGKRATGPEGVGLLSRSLRLLSVVSFALWIPGVRGLLTKYLFPGAATPVSRDPKGSAQAPRSPAAR
jgi:Vitamin K-dependent gamma-carboxylase